MTATVCRRMREWHDKGYLWRSVWITLYSWSSLSKSLLPQSAEIADKCGELHSILSLKSSRRYSLEPAFIQSIIDAISDAAFHCSVHDFGSGCPS